MFRRIALFHLHLVYKVFLVLLSLLTFVTVLYTLGNATGVTESKVTAVFELPGNLNEFLDKGIQSFDLYLESQ